MSVSIRRGWVVWSSLLLISLVAGVVRAGEIPYIAVIEKVAGAVGFFTEDGKQLGQVKVGSFPHEGVVSKDGRLLYVGNNGVLWMTEDSMGTNTISVVDILAMKKVTDIDLGRFHRPHGMAWLPGSDFLLATTERPFGLIVVNPAARQVVRDYAVNGKSPHMVFPAPGGQRVFVSNADSDSVAAIELKTGRVKLISAGAHPQGGVFSPDGNRLYVTATNSNQIAVIDTHTQEVLETIATGKGPSRIAVTPDGKTLVYNLQYEPGVGFADVASHKQVATITIGGRPLSLTMTRDGRRAFAGIQDQDHVLFISVPERRIERVVATPKGSGPDPAIPLAQH